MLYRCYEQMQLTADSDWEPLGYNLFPDYGEWGERRVAAEERREKCHPMLDFFFSPISKARILWTALLENCEN